MAKKPSRHRRVSSKQHDANSSIPESVTSELIDQIRRMPDCPAVQYLKDQFLSKFVSSDTDPASVRRTRAINKWLAVERNNEATNVRLLTTPLDSQILPGVAFGSFVEFACRTMTSIIGETVPIDALVGAFSGGASTSRVRTESHPAGKYLGQTDITSAALGWFKLIMQELPGWNGFGDYMSIRVVPGNVLFTVPKNTTIDRCAAKEPDLNMFLQKGVGNHFRRCLRRVGINLNDQSRNKDLARVGSITGELATLDLSSASDSVTTELVAMLLPPLWFDLLNGLRSPVTAIDGEEHVNEMFSSMGNGFTFELESLLFYVLARTTAYFTRSRGIISVYGDDIICPSRLAEDLIQVLDYCGFEVNTDKSFWSGSFRESCGGHYNNGVDITPFYIRKPLAKLTDVIHAANQLRLWASRSGIGVLDPRAEPIWAWLRDMVPVCFFGGSDYGSITQLVSPHEPKQRLVARSRPSRVGSVAPDIVRSTSNGHLSGGWENILLNGVPLSEVDGFEGPCWNPRSGSERPHGLELSLEGCYVHWLNTTWARDTLGEAVVTSSVATVGTTYRRRSVGVSPYSSRSITPFISEV